METLHLNLHVAIAANVIYSQQERSQKNAAKNPHLKDLDNRSLTCPPTICPTALSILTPDPIPSIPLAIPPHTVALGFAFAPPAPPMIALFTLSSSLMISSPVVRAQITSGDCEE